MYFKRVGCLKKFAAAFFGSLAICPALVLYFFAAADFFLEETASSPQEGAGRSRNICEDFKERPVSAPRVQRHALVVITAPWNIQARLVTFSDTEKQFTHT